VGWVMTEPKVAKVAVDWEAVERHYRAGIKTVRQLAKEFSISHTAIQKHADKFGWVRDLTEKIQQTTKNLVATQVVANSVATETKLTEAHTVRVYSEISASVEMLQRDDLTMGLSVVRSQMNELSTLGRPDLMANLEQIADMLDKSGTDENGRAIVDKANELYRYIISLPGRVKMVKEISGAHGVYIPLQRKVFGLDAKDSNASPYEDMLRSIAAES
jgi:hypothetical protein